MIDSLEILGVRVFGPKKIKVGMNKRSFDRLAALAEKMEAEIAGIVKDALKGYEFVHHGILQGGSLRYANEKVCGLDFYKLPSFEPGNAGVIHFALTKKLYERYNDLAKAVDVSEDELLRKALGFYEFIIQKAEEYDDVLYEYPEKIIPLRGNRFIELLTSEE